MPGIGGLEAARRIHAVRPAAALVLITADSGFSTRDLGELPAAVVKKRSLTPTALTDVWQGLAPSDAS